MKKERLVFLLLLMNLSLFSQVSKGRYFNEIGGTIWQTSVRVDTHTISDLKNFGLSIVEMDVDSLKSDSNIWTIDETIKVENLDAKTKKRTLILECEYIHNKEEKTLELLIENRNIKFSYVPVSTGAHIGFTRRKK